MNKYIRFTNVDGTTSEPEKTKFEYEIGETIRVNSSTRYKCIGKNIIAGDLVHEFKEGEIIFNFDW